MPKSWIQIGPWPGGRPARPVLVAPVVLACAVLVPEAPLVVRRR